VAAFIIIGFYLISETFFTLDILVAALRNYWSEQHEVSFFS